jgi:hypothetical protein
MKLPNGDKAQLGDKLERYSLNFQHLKGKDKAVMFRNRLGIILENKDLLEAALLESVINHEAEIHNMTEYGIQYNVRFWMTTEAGNSWVLGCWIIRSDENFPRLTNAYPVNQ